VCGKPDWCLFTGDPGNPTAIVCARIESPKRCGEAGWLHVLRDDGPTWAPWRRTLGKIAATAPAPIDTRRIDLERLAADCRQAVQPEALDKLAGSLGLSVPSLTRLGIGWSSHHTAWTFPMSDAHGNVVGIRLRLPDGRKLSVRGGREGLFIPAALDYSGRLLIAEGPTDTAALLDLGFCAVGRPSCTGGVKLLRELVRKLAVPEAVIVADGDASGQRGAESLAAVLVAYCPAVRIIAPPPGVKDARAWKQRGATAADVQAAIDAAAVRNLAIKIRRKDAKGR
jgi:phage/plasmid primase-like uncharacterized protein